ncbi:MAG: Asp-tRNA(Asn)/Glu-tRNA(Gln) amidotransferase subunit GatB [Chitinophagaceae bacterium]|nr:Asp-tRNA(Asn)/Glu-tRNA(Gln) amidotransferase subunit GatB [Chitinophagaceae bacterium]
MIEKDQYEIVVGLEVHAQLLTQSKLFCGDSIAFGAEPNTHVSPITLAHPGTLPKMNRTAIEFAVKMGLACHCEIEQQNYFARKNYFYPDLPKGFQLSQHTTPICKGGSVKISVAGKEKNIRLNRIHLEEDAGKSLHDADPENTCIDLNRAGTPLIEIVTEPDLRSGEEAFAYLTEIRKLVRYLEICDGNMEEGSLRCDANISVREKGGTKLGTRVEVKNLNSIRNVKRAIEAESKRLIKIVEQGGTIVQQTRSFDANSGTSFAIRDKEDADDYRYFPEPDLPPFHLQDEFIERIRKTIPELPAEKIKRYVSELNLSEYDALVITDEKVFADYFEELTKINNKFKSGANWMLGPVKAWLNENNKDITEFPLQPAQLAKLIALTDDGKISFSSASTKLFDHLIKDPGGDPEKLTEEMNLLQQSDTSAILPLVDAVIEKFSNKVAEYKKGKKGLLAMFAGEVIKRSKGKADPKVVNELLLEKLKS